MGGDTFLRAGVGAEWYQVLGSAVIRQAMLDAHGTRWARVQDVADAVTFLLGEDGRLEWWCHLSGLPFPTVQRLAREALTGRGNGHGNGHGNGKRAKRPDSIGENADGGGIMKDESGPRPCNQHGPGP